MSTIYCINPNCQQRQNEEDYDVCHNCGFPLVLNGHYQATQLLRPLSKSFYVDVFEAIDLRARSEPKVLKVLKTSDSKLLQLFQREAQVLRQLSHHGIPKLAAEGFFPFPNAAHPQYQCLVMEKITGRDLANWSQDYRLNSTTKTLNWLTQLVDILDMLHSNNLFHRDIKPANIILKPSGDLVLVDFGAVRLVTETIYREDDITLVLTPGYAPPEQCNSQAVPQSDFYALGRTFVHLLTGVHPIELEDFTGRVKWRELLPPQLSADLTDFIEELMSPTVGERPQNTTAIRQRLNYLGESLPGKKIKAGRTEIEQQQHHFSPNNVTNFFQKTTISVFKQFQQYYKKIGLIAGVIVLLPTIVPGAILLPSIVPTDYHYRVSRKPYLDIHYGDFNNKWLLLSGSKTLPSGNSQWQYFASDKFTVNNPQIKLARPVVEGTNANGKVLFDDLAVVEYSPGGQLTRSFPPDKLNTNTLTSWGYWSVNKSGEFGSSADGRSDRSSIYIRGSTANSFMRNGYTFRPLQGHSYRISGWMKGENISPDSICKLRIDFLGDP